MAGVDIWTWFSPFLTWCSNRNTPFYSGQSYTWRRNRILHFCIKLPLPANTISQDALTDHGCSMASSRSRSACDTTHVTRGWSYMASPMSEGGLWAADKVNHGRKTVERNKSRVRATGKSSPPIFSVCMRGEARSTRSLLSVPVHQQQVFLKRQPRNGGSAGLLWLTWVLTHRWKAS